MDGRLNRRQALGALGTVGLGAVLPACDEEADSLDGANACRVTAELTEGPFYFDAGTVRRDIREDREGVELRLRLRVREAGTCRPMRDAMVDIWHSDAQGVYSGFDAGEGERFLRGAQATDQRGIAEFVTIWPGPYEGRTPHIHAKVHFDRRTALTTQLFFEDALSERVFRDRRYRAPTVDNRSDGIFDRSLVMSARRAGRAWVGEMNFDVERA